jgi:hypothetical protein
VLRIDEAFEGVELEELVGGMARDGRRLAQVEVGPPATSLPSGGRSQQHLQLLGSEGRHE